MITFDTLGTVNSIGSGTTFGVTDASTAGSTVLAWIMFASTTNNGAVTASYGAAPMTQVGSTYALNSFTFSSSTYFSFIGLFTIASPGGGGTITFTTTASGSAKGISESWLGVSSVTGLTTNKGTGTSLSLSSVASAPGHVVSNLFGAPQGGTISAYSQTSRWNDHAGTWPSGEVLGDAAGASAVSFSATLGSSGVWGGVAADLIPAQRIPTISRVPVMRSALY